MAMGNEDAPGSRSKLALFSQTIWQKSCPVSVRAEGGITSAPARSTHLFLRDGRMKEIFAAASFGALSSQFLWSIRKTSFLPLQSRSFNFLALSLSLSLSLSRAKCCLKLRTLNISLNPKIETVL